MLGSRSSLLALTQTETIRDALQSLYPDVEFSIITMKSAADKNQ